MDYTLAQWLLIFFIYALFGWVWETSLVSIGEKKWVNRGFLFGPWVPIYGFGAVIILFLTLPVKDNFLYVFLLGMLGASVLEYFTGVFMEKIYKVRYWDYSDKKFNLNGHICLMASLTWGVFSIILVEFLYTPVEELIVSIPYPVTETISHTLLFFFAIDTAISTRKALDFKAMLEEFRENSKLVTSIELKLNKLNEDINENISEIEALKERLVFEYKNRERLADDLKEKIQEVLDKHPSSKSLDFGPTIKEFRESMMERRDSLMTKLNK